MCPPVFRASAGHRGFSSVFDASGELWTPYGVDRVLGDGRRLKIVDETGNQYHCFTMSFSGRRLAEGVERLLVIKLSCNANSYSFCPRVYPLNIPDTRDVTRSRPRVAEWQRIS